MIKLVRDGYDVQKRLSVKVVQSTIEIGLVVVSSGDSYMCVCVWSEYTIQYSRAIAGCPVFRQGHRERGPKKESDTFFKRRGVQTAKALDRAK